MSNTNPSPPRPEDQGMVAMSRPPPLDGFVLVPDYPRYLVNRDGVIYSGIRSGRFLRPTIGPHSYPYVSLMPTGAKRAQKELVHRLVARAFLPNPGNLPTVNHIDGCKLNCHVANLQWCSYAQNNSHARDRGLALNFGEHHYRARLKAHDVRAIRLLARAGVFHREIAARFGVGRKNITKIVNRQIWRRAV